MRHSVVRAAFIVNRLETRIRRGDPGTSRTGGVVILFVLLLPVLLAMVAFAVDVGRVTMLRSELQNVVDSGTLAAQIQLRTKPNAVGKAKKVSTFDLLWISSIRVRLLQDTTDDPVTLIPELIEPTSRRSDTNPNGSLIRPLVPLFSELDAG